MKYILITFVFIIIFCGVLKAQKGVAENGFYPQGYVGGDTWTGEVTSVDEEKQMITLTYTSKKKEETFTGFLVRDYWGPQDKAGNYQAVKLPQLIGYRIRVYYVSKTKKDDTGKKTKTNHIYIIKIVPKDK